MERGKFVTRRIGMRLATVVTKMTVTQTPEDGARFPGGEFECPRDQRFRVNAPGRV